MLIRTDPTAPLAPVLPEPSNEFVEGASRSPSIAATKQGQPTIVITPEGSSPNLRPKIILKIRQATERRERAKVEGGTGGDMEID